MHAPFVPTSCWHGTSSLLNIENVRNGWVNFKIKDVCVADPAPILQILMERHGDELVKIFMELYGDDLLQGKIIDASDCGLQQDAFVVVEVEGVARPLVVPMNRIKGPICE